MSTQDLLRGIQSNATNNINRLKQKGRGAGAKGKSASKKGPCEECLRGNNCYCSTNQNHLFTAVQVSEYLRTSSSTSPTRSRTSELSEPSQRKRSPWPKRRRKTEDSRLEERRSDRPRTRTTTLEAAAAVSLEASKTAIARRT